MNRTVWSHSSTKISTEIIFSAGADQRWQWTRPVNSGFTLRASKGFNCCRSVPLTNRCCCLSVSRGLNHLLHSGLFFYSRQNWSKKRGLSALEWGRGTERVGHSRYLESRLKYLINLYTRIFPKIQKFVGFQILNYHLSYLCKFI